MSGWELPRASESYFLRFKNCPALANVRLKVVFWLNLKLFSSAWEHHRCEGWGNQIEWNACVFCLRLTQACQTLAEKKKKIGPFVALAFLGGGFNDIFYFQPYLEKMNPILTYIFQMGWNHQLDFLGHGSWTRKKSPVACLENFVGTLEPYWDWIYEALIF